MKMRLESPIKLSAMQVPLGTIAIVLIGLLAFQSGNSQDERLVFMVNPSGSFSGNPPNPTIFELVEPTTITKIRNYHWNGSQGKAPGWIKLMSDGNTVGQWDASGESGNTYWVVKPNIDLQPGKYTVIDSDNSTWSQNTEGKGITWVYGR